MNEYLYFHFYRSLCHTNIATSTEVQSVSTFATSGSDRSLLKREHPNVRNVIKSPQELGGDKGMFPLPD